MPTDLSQEEEKLVGRAHVSKTKTDGLKKGLRNQQLLLSAQKKEYVSKHLTAPDELISFLQAEQTGKAGHLRGSSEIHQGQLQPR